MAAEEGDTPMEVEERVDAPGEAPVAVAMTMPLTKVADGEEGRVKNSRR